MINNSEDLDKSFQSYIEKEKITSSRSLCLFGALLYVAFGIADIYALSSISLTEVLIIRGGVVLAMLLAVAVSYTKYFFKFYELTLSFIYIVTALGIEFIIYLSLPTDHASVAYFAGLLLVIMTVFSWAYFRIITSLFIISTIIVTYAFLEIGRDLNISSLLVNIFFLVSAGSIGFISKLMRDKHLKENFLLQQSLSEALKEKTVEAKDNAYLANHDALTDLPNRRLVTEQLERSLIEAQEKNKVLAILFLDLDGFKQVNDIYGHAVGDQVLISVARRLEGAIREGDLLARLGGDEYLIGLMMEYESVQTIEKMADDFMRVIEQPMSIDGLKFKIGASIGIAAYPMHGNKISILLDIADKKMYQTKHADTQQELGESEPVVIFPGNKRRK